MREEKLPLQPFGVQSMKIANDRILYRRSGDPSGVDREVAVDAALDFAKKLQELIEQARGG